MACNSNLPIVGPTAAGESVDCLPHRTAAADAVSAPIDTAWHIDGYEITAKLGQGGMGTVWRAIQLSTHREVALKVMHAGLAPSDRARRRFEREIELTASLQHPRIARVYDSGVQKGAYFYAMELIDGVPIDQYAADHHLSRRAILKLFHSIALVVQFAHQRGVIHRDLKPSNLLVDHQGEPHVLDFGVAKLFDLKNSDPPVSIAGEVVGTPAFMSPEQAEGSAAAVDMRSDVYSLGAVLYLLLTGKLPHDATGTYIKVLRCISEQEIIRPTKARADIGSELEAILLKALSRDVESRYASAGTFAEDLNNYLTGEPLLARRRTAVYFLRKKLWKHRLIASAVLAGLTGVAGFAARDTMRTRAERDFAVASAAKERAANRLAQLHLADALLAWGDSLTATDQWEDARPKYWQAHDIWSGFSMPTTAADAALADTYQHAPPPLAEFRVPAADPHLVAGFTNDGITAYAGMKGTITSIDPFTGRQQAVSGEVTGHVTECGTSSDGQNIISVVHPMNQLGRLDDACLAEIRESSAGSPCRIYSLSGFNVRDLTVSPDARLAVYNANLQRGDALDIMTFLTALDPSSIALKLPIDSGTAFAFSADGRNLYAGGFAGWISKFQTPYGSPAWRTKSVLVDISAIQCTANGDRLLVGNDAGRLGLYDSAGQLVRTWVAHRTAIAHLAVTHDGALALSSDADGQLRLWETGTGSLLFSVQAHAGPLGSLAFFDNGARALSAGPGGSIKIWQTTPNAGVIGSFASQSPCALALSPDGQLAACGHRTGLIVLIDVATGKCLCRLKLGHEPVDSICFSPDGLVAFAAQGRMVYHWNVDAVALPTHFRLGPDGPYEAGSHALLSSQGTVALNFEEGGDAAAWNTRTGLRLQVLPVHAVRLAALSADGNAAVVYSRNGIQVFDTTSGHSIATCHLLADEEPLQLALSPQARSVLASTPSGKLYLWVVGEEHGLHLLASEAGAIEHMQFSPDGNFAVTGSDSALKLWDIPNQRELRTLSQYENLETLVALGSDCSIFFARIAEDTTTRFRFIDLQRPLAYRDLANRLPAAWRALQANPNDANALSTLGQWYAFRGESDWAEKLFDAAHQRGAQIPLMVLARTNWKTGKPDQAAELFRQMLQSETSPAQRVYLTLCLRAADEEAKSHSPLALSTNPASQ